MAPTGEVSDKRPYFQFSPAFFNPYGRTEEEQNADEERMRVGIAMNMDMQPFIEAPYIGYYRGFVYNLGDSVCGWLQHVDSEKNGGPVRIVFTCHGDEGTGTIEDAYGKQWYVNVLFLNSFSGGPTTECLHASAWRCVRFA